MTTRKPMSPVIIEQNREVSFYTPLDGSRMGREAGKASGDTGERGHDACSPERARRPAETGRNGEKA